jgi:CheY-like chemotaxis protein
MTQALASERLAILVVEDNPADADLVREMLLDVGPVIAGSYGSSAAQPSKC